MKRLSAIVLGMLFVAAPAWAQAEATRLRVGLPPGGELVAPATPRLAPQDGIRLDLGLSRDFAFGPVAATAGSPTLVGAGHLALGAFVEYPLDSLRFGGSITQGAWSRRAELSAGYDGGDTSLRIRLGSEWGNGDGDSYFSPNPALTGGHAYSPPGRDYDLSLSLSHAVTPNLVVSGLAAASRSEAPAAADEDTFLFGASIGLRF